MTMRLTQGKLAFTLTPSGAPAAAFQTTVLVGAVDSPLGVTWAIDLAAWQAQGAVARTATGFQATVPLRARITWSGGGGDGGGSAQEVAEIDYPAQGCTFQVHATNVMVELKGTMPGNATTVPRLAGWMTMGSSGVRREGPSLTEAITVVHDGASANFAVPVRARAVRVTSILGSNLRLSQFTGDLVPVNAVADAQFNGDGGALPANRAKWFPLDPECQRINLANITGDGGNAICRLVWLVELG